MPTSNPRVNVTLPTSLDQLVTRLASYQRVSKSQVLRELLEAAEPALQRVVVLMDAATTASAQVRSGLAHQLDQSSQLGQDAYAVILSRLDRAASSAGDLVSQAEAVKGRRPRKPRKEPGADAGGALRRRAGPRAEEGSSGVSKAKNPPASNRGVKSPPAKGKQGVAARQAPRKARAS